MEDLIATVLVVPSTDQVNADPMDAEMAVSLDGPEARHNILERRRAELDSFAQECIATHAASLDAGGLAGVAMDAQDGGGYQVLEALGAVIIDDALISREALEQQGARIFENVLIPLIQPALENEALQDLDALSFWHLERINVEAARGRDLRGRNVLVGVLDTGIDPNHPEFAGKTIHFERFDQNGNRLNSTTPHDVGSHGTHVCALIAGRQAGVAPEADLAVACVLTVPTPQGLGGFLVQISAGLNWLLTTSFRGPTGDPGVDVANASLGGTGYRDYLYSALRAARIAPGTLLVAAIGNSGENGINNHGSPGNYDNTIGVGAMDDSDAVASFSDWGSVSQHSGLEKPDLCAPGVAILSAVPGGGYATKNGTSMASPIVTGTCALLLERTPNLSSDVSGLVTEVYSLVSASADPRAGRGRLDLTNI